MKTIQDADALLTYKVGPVYCCSPTLSVEAVMMPPKLNHPPGSEPGVFKHVSGMVKVVDLRARFGLPDAYWQQPGKIIVVEVEAGRTGFWVDEILDVIEFPKQGWKPLSALMPREVFSRLLLLKNNIHLYADFEKMGSFQGQAYLREHIQNLIAEDVLEKEYKAKSSASSLTESKTTQILSQKEDVSEQQDARDKLLSDDNLNETKQQAENKEQVEQPNRKYNKKYDIKPLSKTSTLQAKKISPKKITVASSPDVKAYAERSPVVNKELDRQKNIGLPQEDYARSYNSENFNQNNSGQNKEKSSLSPLWIIIGFILLISFAVYLLWSSEKEVGHKVLPKNIVSANKNSVDTQDKAEIEHAIVSNIIEPEVGIESDIDINERNVEKKEEIDESSSRYQAKIEKDDLGITIILSDDLVSSNEEIVVKKEKKYKEETTNENLIEDTHDAVEMLSAEKSKKLEVLDSRLASSEVVLVKSKKAHAPVESELLIVHIVVKGDTLWDIAKKYVENPFKYAELARLSKIKNPDLIYPGDRVRIIRKLRK